jgi:toxin HigB-1
MCIYIEMCNHICYNTIELISDTAMINTFKQKELKKLFETGISKKFAKTVHRKILRVLTLLDSCEEVEDMNYPGSDFHKLSGDKKEYYSVSINGNWKLIFKFKNGDAFDIEYLDYH